MRLPAWNQLDDVYTMRLVFKDAGHKISARQFRLFLCACCRRIPGVPADEVLRPLLELAESAADGLVKHKELVAAVNAARSDWQPSSGDSALAEARRHTFNLVASAAAPKTITWTDTHSLIYSMSGIVALYSASRGEPRFTQLANAEARAQAAMFGHILGDPFHPITPPESWPTVVRQLAQSLYDGQPCHFALHDALAEAGLPEWAEHFRTPEHPKGCWALDVILGKS
jgi:hypothetical protein